VKYESAVAGGALASELVEHCGARLIKWSCPREIEFRAELPLTRVGKVDFRALESEATAAAPR
jgi:long-chain acyl-CoA synthetase